MASFVIEPTLDDTGVMDFVFNGYALLEGVVPEGFNRHCANLSGGGIGEVIESAEFRREVLLQTKVAGVVRSLLGPDFYLPLEGHHHLFEGSHNGQTWHSDGLTEQGYGITHLQCYYYPHEVTIDDGPTMILPGSHNRLIDREAIAHYGDIIGQLSLTVPAGTVGITRYGIWHKAGPKFNSKRRSMIKFSYFRSQPPKRDWLNAKTEVPEFRNIGRHPYVTEVESYRDRRRCHRTWEWLCGRSKTKEGYDSLRQHPEAYANYCVRLSQLDF